MEVPGVRTSASTSPLVESRWLPIGTMSITEKGWVVRRGAQRDVVRGQAVTGLRTADTRVWRGQTGGCMAVGRRRDSGPEAQAREQAGAPKRHKSLQRELVSPKSQICEVAKNVAVVPTFRTQ